MIGVVLAGGASRRMGDRDKLLETLGGRTLLANAIERLEPQVDRVVVAGPSTLEAHCSVPVLPDPIEGRAGPLAGLLAAMGVAGDDMVLTVPADTPFFPTDLAQRLDGEGAAIAWNAFPQPVFGAWPAALEPRLRAFLERGERKIMLFAREVGFRRASFEDELAFFNVNTLDDLRQARALLEPAT